MQSASPMVPGMDQTIEERDFALSARGQLVTNFSF